MVYQKEFFALQIDFARTAAKLSSVSLDRALLDYTNLFIRFGLGRDFEGSHPGWRRYVDGLVPGVDVCDWTYHFYLAQGEDSQSAATRACFSYAMQDPRCVRIHFRNAEAAGSPLSVKRLNARLTELRAIFSYVKQNEPDASRVVGTSWLYNLPAYQRCFPESYTASAKPTSPRYRHVSLWGQFLDRAGRLRQGNVGEFQRRLSGLADAQGLAFAFPLQALAVEAPITDFYHFYGIASD